ncbi:hypothetical protein B0I35DRAFT_484154 [Stachybotrys elegans]|uniref:Rho-GAP domain-containing protein n=1 Tax=Stachybotrys elegans TaxID=80388 RepID=A0A8K0SFF7_9HYPO|nr:hypothetical protein B0I35DRAFT_484154 [Stachybotrys elegans]
MADYNPSTGDAATSSQTQPPLSHDAPASMSLGDTTASSQPPTGAKGDAMDNRTSADGEPANPVPTSLAVQNPAHPPANPETLEQVAKVLKSEIGVPTLLNRLKQSVAATKEFGLFLKKRSTIEDDHAQSLKKLCRLSQDNMRRADHRQGTFLHGYEEMMQMHDRIAENGIQFALSLHQMHEDLSELVAFAERSRKGLKASGLAAEQKVADLEQAMRKSKAKYDSLAEEYDRARTGEVKQSGKVFGFKGKSAAQQEEDLLRKVQAADQVYQTSVQTLQYEKSQLEIHSRPETIKSLQDLIKETDAGLTLQLQKFASFNEKLLLSNGLIISPLRSTGGEYQPRGLRSSVSSIDNEKDFNDYVMSNYGRMAPNTGEIKYEKNPLLNPGSQTGPSSALPARTASPQSTGLPYQPPLNREARSNTLNFPSPSTASPPPQAPAPINQGYNHQPPSQDHQPYPPSSSFTPHNRTASQGTTQSFTQQQQQQQPMAPRNQPQSHARPGNGLSISSQGPPQLGALPFQGNQSPVQSSAPPFSSVDSSAAGGVSLSQGFQAASHGHGPGSSAPPSGPPQPVFGVPLTRLYERDGLAVPMVVHQCIQAVELYGLEVEGIYRQSGSQNHIHKLKGMFDTNSRNPALDFRNPENFYEDVNSVTGLLKLFLRDLPDPLLTTEHHNAFIAAAKRDDDIARRDALHGIINSLPDPNYATLRALALHLYRVMDKSHINRMNSHNLAVIFGPTLMGTDPSTAIADAGWQIRVIDTILQNTYQIFDED